jgi:hypothetical protein
VANTLPQTAARLTHSNSRRDHSLRQIALLGGEHRARWENRSSRFLSNPRDGAGKAWDGLGILIKNGVPVDGTGKSGFKADGASLLVSTTNIWG